MRIVVYRIFVLFVRFCLVVRMEGGGELTLHSHHIRNKRNEKDMNGLFLDSCHIIVLHR